MEGLKDVPDSLFLNSCKRSLTWEKSTCVAGCFQSRERAVTKVGIWRACTAEEAAAVATLRARAIGPGDVAGYSFRRGSE